MNELHTVTGMWFVIGRIIAKNWIGCHLSMWVTIIPAKCQTLPLQLWVCDLNSMSSHWKLNYIQRFSGCLTKIRSRNWRMRVSMAYWNKLCTWSPSQTTVSSSLDRCRAYLQAGRLHVNGKGTYYALSRQCACAKILNGSWSSNLKTSVQAVWNRWTGLLDWNIELEYRNGLNCCKKPFSWHDNFLEFGYSLSYFTNLLHALFSCPASKSWRSKVTCIFN